MLLPPLHRVERRAFQIIRVIVIGRTTRLSAERGGDVEGKRAAVDALLLGGAVAAGVVGGALEVLASVTGGEDVGELGEGVAPLTGLAVSYLFAHASISERLKREEGQKLTS